MSKKAIAFVILSSLILGAIGASIWQRYLVPELNTVPFLVRYNLAPRSAGPLVINTTQQIRVNEGSDTIAAVQTVEPWTAAILSAGQVIGGGLIVTSDGLIATTQEAELQPNLAVKLFDGTIFSGAAVVASDPSSSLVFVKINASGLATANFGSPQNLQLSQRMLALLPSGGDSQATDIVSYLSSTLNYINYSQTFSSEKNQRTFGVGAIQNIMPGATIFSSDGAVQGISSGSEIIAAGTIQSALNSYFNNRGKIVRNLIGINYEYISKINAQLNSQKQGVVLKRSATAPAVVLGSPAQKSGLLEGDIIYAIDDTQIEANNNFEDLIQRHKPADIIKLSIQSGKILKTTNLIIAAFGSGSAQ